MAQDKNNKTCCRIGVLSSHFAASHPPMAASSSEKDAALAATQSDEPTIFDKIIKKEIPSKVVYEDEKLGINICMFDIIGEFGAEGGFILVKDVLAFRDISPQAPTHIIIIPKFKDGLTGISKAEDRHIEILGHLLYVAKLIAKQEGLNDGFRIVINDGPKGCQSVYHLHIHLLGGREMNWPPG